MKDYFDINRAGWDQRARVHINSKFYDVDGFLGGQTSLREIESAELPAVDGKSLLHLQCHFGLDTLSWARRGAHCTGIDFSPVAIDKAVELAAITGLDARFLCTDVYSYDRGAGDAFDIVFTSYGAVCWLPDLDRWAQVIASNLAEGGTFYMAEFHPLYDLFAGYSYFGSEQPDIEEEGTYTENGDQISNRLATWAHPMGRVINALVRAGIVIQRVNEYPFSPYNCFEGMTEREPGRYYLVHKGQDIPLVYSITGCKQAAAL